MPVGDRHIVGPDGYALCKGKGPLRGYNATSPPCRDCNARKNNNSSRWTVAVPQSAPISSRYRSPHAMMRKRPERLSV